MKFWKEHAAFRISFVSVLAVIGLFLVIWGWTMTGKMAGLGIMLGGVALLLCGLGIYTAQYK